MERGELGDTINPWGVALFRTIRAAETPTYAEETAFAKWLDQTSDREEARRDRVYGAAGVIPATLWIVLLLAAAIIFCFMLFFADPAEMKRSQAMLVGSATAVVMVTLLAIFALDNPYRPGLGSVQPVAMERSLRILDEVRAALGETAAASLRRERHRAMTDRTEIVATVLLSLAAVATAWSGYQATRWNGEQTKASSRTNAIRIDAARAQGLSEAQKEVDVATFIQWIDAYAQTRPSSRSSTRRGSVRSSSLRSHAWIATKPLTNPNAPLTPFVMPQYKLAAEAGGRAAGCRCRGVGGAGPAQHPTRVELRPRRRPLLGVALLRRHEHEARRPAAAAIRTRRRMHAVPRDRDLAGDPADQHPPS